jgi:PadR family transcriptional regulator, regulatory protein PadR
MAIESRRSQMLRGVLDLWGSIYPLLGRLEREGLVATHRAASEGGPPRKYYRASQSGGSALAEGVRAWRDVRGEVDSVLATIEAEVAR